VYFEKLIYIKTQRLKEEYFKSIRVWSSSWRKNLLSIATRYLVFCDEEFYFFLWAFESL